MIWLETLLFEISKLFLFPVLALIVLVFGYALWITGGFITEGIQRKRGKFTPLKALKLPGVEDYELVILKRTETMRIASRTAPMLGLVATMIPMGPALVELGQGNMAGVGNHLAVAFAAVIVALLSASLIYAVLTVRRRWLLNELREIEREMKP